MACRQSLSQAQTVVILQHGPLLKLVEHLQLFYIGAKLCLRNETNGSKDVRSELLDNCWHEISLKLNGHSHNIEFAYFLLKSQTIFKLQFFQDSI